MTSSIKPNKLYGFGGYLSKLANTTKLVGNLPKPTQLFISGEPEDKVKFTHISSGSYHGQIGYQTSSGSKLYTFGSNTSGQLGLSSIGEEYLAGNVALSHNNIIKLSSGREHSAALVKDVKGLVKLYTTGNSMLGQLGLGLSKNYSKSVDAVNTFKYVDKFTPVELGFEVIDVKCGLDHTVILSDSGDIYTCGWGSDGQLGLGPNHTSDANKFTKVNMPEDQKVLKFTVRHDCTIVLTDKGKLYSWGNSEYGQACHGRKIDRVLEPMEFKVDFKVSELSTGGNSTLLLSDNGEVYTCGCGSIGLGDNIKEALVPTKIDSLKNISKIFSGGNSAAVLDNDNNLYVWGIGSPLFSRLGLIHHKSVFQPTKLLVDDNLEIKEVEMGWQFGLIIGEN